MASFLRSGVAGAAAGVAGIAAAVMFGSFPVLWALTGIASFALGMGLGAFALLDAPKDWSSQRVFGARTLALAIAISCVGAWYSGVAPVLFASVVALAVAVPLLRTEGQ